MFIRHLAFILSEAIIFLFYYTILTYPPFSLPFKPEIIVTYLDMHLKSCPVFAMSTYFCPKIVKNRGVFGFG